MKQGFIKVAAVTPKIKVAEPAHNAAVICAELEKAYARGAKIIVFPELCLRLYLRRLISAAAFAGRGQGPAFYGNGGHQGYGCSGYGGAAHGT